MTPKPLALYGWQGADGEECDVARALIGVVGMVLIVGCQDVSTVGGGPDAIPDTALPDAVAADVASPDAAPADIAPADVAPPDAAGPDPCDVACDYIADCAADDAVMCPGITDANRDLVAASCRPVCGASAAFAPAFRPGVACDRTLTLLRDFLPEFAAICGEVPDAG